MSSSGPYDGSGGYDSIDNSGSSSGGGGGAGSGSLKAVEFVPIEGSSTITIGGAYLPGTTEAEQSGGVNAPTKRTEEGYDYTTRVNREARTASFDGWVNSAGLQGLRRLRRKKEPFAVSAGHVIMQRAVLDDLQETSSDDAKGGAYDVSVDVREAFLAKSGTSSITAVPNSGKKAGSSSMTDNLFSGVLTSGKNIDDIGDG